MILGTPTEGKTADGEVALKQVNEIRARYRRSRRA
jgi:hypothetical protein